MRNHVASRITMKSGEKKQIEFSCSLNLHERNVLVEGSVKFGEDSLSKTR